MSEESAVTPSSVMAPLKVAGIDAAGPVDSATPCRVLRRKKTSSDFPELSGSALLISQREMSMTHLELQELGPIS
jgi:hypothetical protein